MLNCIIKNQKSSKYYPLILIGLLLNSSLLLVNRFIIEIPDIIAILIEIIAIILILSSAYLMARERRLAEDKKDDSKKWTLNRKLLLHFALPL